MTNFKQIESTNILGGIIKISLSGRTDVKGTQEIDLKLTSYTATQNAVTVDMSAVSFLASIDIRTLLMTAKALSGQGVNGHSQSG